MPKPLVMPHGNSQKPIFTMNDQYPEFGPMTGVLDSISRSLPSAVTGWN